MNKKLKKAFKYAAWATTLLLVVLICIVGWIWHLAGAKMPADSEVRIYIPTGSTPEAIADTLKSNFGDDFGGKVAQLWTWQKGRATMATGSYLVKPGTTALSLSRAIRAGAQTPVRTTFNNARTLDQVAERLCSKLEITPEAFLEACDSILPDAGFKKAEYVAAFLSDTYEFYWNASAQSVVKRLLNERNKFWDANGRRDKAAALGLSPVKTATLASIVEEETAKSDEQPIVARLYLNRLGKGMLLQADPTVKFAVGDFSLRRILNVHLQTESPYNTYKHTGLPPGPIRVADKRTIDAVLSAPQHNYLYMCAKPDFSGYHNFTSSYDQHLRNARQYQAALNQRNIN